jgi:hypothetical protein
VHEGHPPASGFPGATEYLSWDHERLTGILDEVALRIDAGAIADAGGRYAEFDSGLRRHIQAEEKVLFPVFEAFTGLGSGPTSLLREEHRTILQALDAMGRGVAAGDAAAFRGAHLDLRETLPGHMAREERIVYLATDACLGESERRVLAERLQREP